MAFEFDEPGVPPDAREDPLVKVLQGPFRPGSFVFEPAAMERPTSAWAHRYREDLRRVSLRHWVGLEEDVAVISVRLPKDAPNPEVRVYRIFDRAGDRMLRILFDCWWDEIKGVHITERPVSIIRMVAALLTFHNGVVVEDSRDVPRLFLGIPISKSVPDLIEGEERGRKVVYQRDEWAHGGVSGRMRGDGGMTITMPTLKF